MIFKKFFLIVLAFAPKFLRFTRWWFGVILLLAFIYGLNLLFPIQKTFSQSGSALLGWAWSENIGWLSLNCDNPELSQPRCLNSYSVNIDSATGNFSGSAWSENIGWIKFDPAGPYPSAPAYSAKLDFGTGQVTGWIRACAGSPNGDCTGGVGPAANSGGWDGWLKMAGSNYQTGYDSVSKKFSGWAWGSDVIGWISWSSSNCDKDGNGFIDIACDGDNSTTPLIPFGTLAPTLNAFPTASALNVSNHSSSSYCPSAPLGLHSFSWTYSDPDNNNESRFQFQVDDDSSFNTTEINREVVVNVPNGSINNQAASVIAAGGIDRLDYNKTYYWRVKVFDSGDPIQDSGWINGSSFTTGPHPYPKVDFDWSPTVPEINKTTKFLDKSSAYGNGQPIQSWDWQFSPDAVPQATSTQNPAVTFTETGNKNISLNIIDASSFSCGTTKTIRAIKEIKIKEI